MFHLGNKSQSDQSWSDSPAKGLEDLYETHSESLSSYIIWNSDIIIIWFPFSSLHLTDTERQFCWIRGQLLKPTLSLAAHVGNAGLNLGFVKCYFPQNSVSSLILQSIKVAIFHKIETGLFLNNL